MVRCQVRWLQDALAISHFNEPIHGNPLKPGEALKIFEASSLPIETPSYHHEVDGNVAAYNGYAPGSSSNAIDRAILL